MSKQTILEYLEEERQKAADNQLRTDEEAARIQTLQHGHHRASKRTSQPRSKPSQLELLAPVKTAAKKKQKKPKKKTVAAVLKKPRVAIKKKKKIRKK